MKVKKKEKFKRKQETIKNREWERERRGKLNVAFGQLDQLLPDYDPSRARSKLAILMAAVGHITHLHQLMQTLSAGKGGATERDTVYASELARLHDRIDTLRRRCQQLAQLLQMADIPVPAPSNDKQATPPTGGKLATSQPHIKWNGNIAHKTVQQRIINSRKDKAEKKENKQLLEVGSTVDKKNPPKTKTSSITKVSEDVEQQSTTSDSPELSPIKKVVDLCNTPLRELTGFTLNSACVLASPSSSPPPPPPPHPSSSPSSSISSPSSSLSSNSPLCAGEILETPVAKNDGRCLVGDAASGEPGVMSCVAMETSDVTSSRNVVAIETNDMTSSRNVVAMETNDMTSSSNVLAMETKDMMSSSTDNGQDSNKLPIGLDSGGGGKVCDQLVTTSQSVTGDNDSSKVTDNPKSLVAVTPGTVADTTSTVTVTSTSISSSSTSSLEASSKSIEVPLQTNSSQSNPAVAVTTPKVAATPSSSGLGISNSVEVPPQPNSSSGHSTVTEVQKKETSRAKSDNSQGKPATVTSAGNSSIPIPATAKPVTVTTAGSSSNPIPATTKPVTVTTTGNTPNQIPVAGTVHVVNPYPSIMPVTVTNFGAPTVNQSIMIVLPDGRVVTVPQQQPQYVINQSVPHMINQSVPQIINHQSPTTIVIGNSAPVIEPIVFKAADRMTVNRAFEGDGTTVNRAGKKGQQKRVLLSKCANKVPIPLVGTQFVVRRTVEMQVKASRVVEKRQRSRKVKKTVVSTESAKVKDVTKVAEFVEAPKTTQVENAKVERDEEGLKPSDGKSTTKVCRNKSVMDKVGMGEQVTNKDKTLQLVVKSDGSMKQNDGKKTEISRNESVLDKDGVNKNLNHDQTQTLVKSVVNNTSSVGALGNNNNSTTQRLENKSSATKALGGNSSATEVLGNSLVPEALSANPNDMTTAGTETPGDSIKLTGKDLDMTTLTDTETGVEGSTSDKTSSVRIEKGETSKAIKESNDSSRNLKLAQDFKTVQGKSEDGGCNPVVVSSLTEPLQGKLFDKDRSAQVLIGDKKKQEVVDSVKTVQEDKDCSSMEVVVSDSRKQKVVEDFEKEVQNQNQSFVAEQGTHPDVIKHGNVLNIENNDENYDDCSDHFGLDTMSDDNDDTENDGPIPSLLVDMPHIKRPADGSVMPPAKKLKTLEQNIPPKTLDQQNDVSDAPDKGSMHGNVFHQDSNSTMVSVEGPVNSNMEDVQMITDSTDILYRETPDPSCSRVDIQRQSNTNVGQKLELSTNSNCSSNYGVEKTVMFPNENQGCPIVNQQQGIASSVSNPIEIKPVGKHCEETVESTTVLGIGNTSKNPVNHQPHTENVATNKETLSDKCYTGNLVGQNVSDNQTQLQITNTSASLLLLPEVGADKLPYRPDSYQTGNASENNTVLDVQDSRMEQNLGRVNQKGSQLLGFPNNSSHSDVIKDITPTSQLSSYPYVSSVNPTNNNLALQKISNFNISSTINTNMSYLSMTTNSARETVQSKNTRDDFVRDPSFSENGMIPLQVVNKVSGGFQENNTTKETSVKHTVEMQTSNQNVKTNGDSFVGTTSNQIGKCGYIELSNRPEKIAIQTQTSIENKIDNNDFHFPQNSGQNTMLTYTELHGKPSMGHNPIISNSKSQDHSSFGVCNVSSNSVSTIGSTSYMGGDKFLEAPNLFWNNSGAEIGGSPVVNSSLPQFANRTVNQTFLKFSENQIVASSSICTSFATPMVTSLSTNQNQMAASNLNLPESGSVCTSSGVLSNYSLPSVTNSAAYQNVTNTSTSLNQSGNVNRNFLNYHTLSSTSGVSLLTATTTCGISPSFANKSSVLLSGSGSKMSIITEQRPIVSYKVNDSRQKTVNPVSNLQPQNSLLENQWNPKIPQHAETAKPNKPGGGNSSGLNYLQLGYASVVKQCDNCCVNKGSEVHDCQQKFPKSSQNQHVAANTSKTIQTGEVIAKCTSGDVKNVGGKIKKDMSTNTSSSEEAPPKVLYGNRKMLPQDISREQLEAGREVLMTNPNKNARKVVKKTVSQQTDDISKRPMIGSSANVGKTGVRKMAASFKMKSTSSCQTVDLETTINSVTKYPQIHGRVAMQNRRKATNFQVGYNVAQNTMKVGNSGGVSNMVQKSTKQVCNIGVTNTKKSTGTSVSVDGSLLQNHQNNMDMMASTSIQNDSALFQHSKPTENSTTSMVPTSTQNTLVPFQHSKPPENQANPLLTPNSLVAFQHSKPSEKQAVLFSSKNHPPKNDKKQDFKSVPQKEKNNTFLDDIRLVLPNSDFSNDIFSTLQVPPGSQHHGSLSPTAAFLDAFPLVSNSKNSEMLIDGENSDAVHHATDSILLGDPNIMDTSGRQNCLQTLNNYNSANIAGVEQHLGMNTDEMTKNPCNKNMNSMHTDQNKAAANSSMPNQQQNSSAYSISALNSAKPSNSLGEKCADHTNKIQDYQSHYTNVNYDYMSANSFQNYNYNSGYKKVAPKFVDSNYGGDINNSFVSNPRDVNNKMAATTYGSQDGGLSYNAYNNWNPKPSMQLQNFDDFQTNYMSGYNHFPSSSASKNVFASDPSYSTSAGMFGNLSGYKSMDTSDSNFVPQPVAGTASSTKLGSKSDAPANFIYTQASTTSNPVTTRSYSCAFSSASDFQAIGFPQSLYSSSTIEDPLSTAPKVTGSKDLMGVEQCASIVTSQAAQTKLVNASKSNNSSIGNKFYVGGNPMNKKQPVMFDNGSIKTSQNAGMDQGGISNATTSKSSTYFPDLGMNQNNSNAVMSKSSSYFPPSLSTTLNNSFNNSTMLFPAQSTYQTTGIFTTITNQTAGIFSSTTATTHANQTVGIFSSGATTTQANQSVGIFSSGATTTQANQTVGIFSSGATTTQANQSVFTFSSGATTSTTTTQANSKGGISAETVKTSQPRMSVNWMTMPDPRTSTLEVGSSSAASAPFIPPDRMFTPHKDALDFIAPIITGGLQPTYSTNSQMFYGMDFPISDAQTLCGTDGSITRTTANPQAQTSSSSALHYSWPTSKSSLSLLSHLDNHGLGIPSTLPTLVGDLALGTNTGPSTPGVNGDYRMSSNTTATIFQTLPEVEDRNNQKSLNNATDVSPVKTSNYCQDMQPKSSALFSTDMPSSKPASYLQAPSKPSNIFDVQSKPSNIFDVQSKLPETPAKSSNFHLDMPTKSSSYSLDVQSKSSASLSTEVPTSKPSNFLQASSKPSNIFDVQSKTNTPANPSNFHFNMSGKPSNYMNASSKPSNIFDMNVTSKPSNTFDVTASSNIFDMQSKPSSNFSDTPSKSTNFTMGNSQSHATAAAQFDAKSSKNPAQNQGQRSGVVADTSKTSSGPNVSHQPQSGGGSFLSVSQLVDQVKTNKKQDGNTYKYVQNIMASDMYYPEITAGSNSTKQIDYKCNTMPQKGPTTNFQPLINVKNAYNPQNRDGYSLLSTEGSQKQNLLTFDSATSNQKQNLLSFDGTTKNQKQNMLPFDGNANTNQKPKDPSTMQQKSVTNTTTRKSETNLQNNNFNDTGLSFLAPSSSTSVAKNSTIPSVAKSSMGSTPVSLPTSLWSQSSSHNVNGCASTAKKSERFSSTKPSTFKSSNKYSAESLISNVQDGASAANADQFSSVTSLNYGACFEMSGHNSSDLPSFGVSTSNLFGATDYHHGSDYGSNQPIPSYQNYFGQTLDNLQPTGTASTTFIAESAVDFQMNLFDSTAPPSYLFPPALNKKSANVEAKSNVKPNPKPANNLIPTSLYSSTMVETKPNKKPDNSLTPAITGVLYPSNTEPKPNLKPDNNLIPASKGVLYPSNVEPKPNLKPDNNLIPASSGVFYQTNTMSSPSTNQRCQKSNSNFPPSAKSNSNFPPSAKSNSNFPPAAKSNSNFPPAANCSSSAANLTASSSSTNSLANFNMSTIFPEMNDKVDPAVAQHHINQQQKQQQPTTASQQQTATTTTTNR